LPVRKARGFIFVGVNAAKFLAVGIINGDQPVMMFAAAVSIESGFIIFCGALGGALCHVAVLSPSWWMDYYKQTKNTQVPREVLTRTLLKVVGGNVTGTLGR
jgi:hypothetical protein